MSTAVEIQPAKAVKPAGSMKKNGMQDCNATLPRRDQTLIYCNNRQAMARQQKGLQTHRRPDIVREARSQRQGGRPHQGARKRAEGRERSRTPGQPCRRSHFRTVNFANIRLLQRRIQTIKDRRAAKEEKERYEKMAEKMHAKRVERLKRREKRNKMIKS